jgi:hypothetical protein
VELRQNVAYGTIGTAGTLGTFFFMTAKDFRRIALGMEGAVEASHMDHPDFRVNGKIFATIHADNAQGMVKLTPEQQDRFIREHPQVFHPAAGAWGRGGSTMVTFAHAKDDVVGEAMTLAWQNLARAAKNESGIRRAKAARIGRTRR